MSGFSKDIGLSVDKIAAIRDMNRRNSEEELNRLIYMIPFMSALRLSDYG